MIKWIRGEKLIYTRLVNGKAGARNRGSDSMSCQNQGLELDCGACSGKRINVIGLRVWLVAAAQPRQASPEPWVGSPRGSSRGTFADRENFISTDTDERAGMNEGNRRAPSLDDASLADHRPPSPSPEPASSLPSIFRPPTRRFP